MKAIEFNASEGSIFENVEIEKLLQSLDEGAVISDNQNNLVFHNRNASLLLNVELDYFLNSNINEIEYFRSLLKRDNLVPQNIKELVSGHKVSIVQKMNGKDNYFENETINIFCKSGEVIGLLYLIRNITKEIELELALSFEAKTDSLSGIGNSRSFYHEIEKEILRASRFNNDLSLLFIDINNFKSFNDIFGHKAGDEMIKITAGTLSSSLRKNIDTAYRYGGDEFVVLLPNTPAKRATIVANRILDNFQLNSKEKLISLIADDKYEANLKKIIHNGHGNKKIGLSIGISEYKSGKSSKELINEADRAMYCAKKSSTENITICV